MSTPSGPVRVALGVLTAAAVLASGCSGGDPAEAAAPSAPAQFSATFDVESPMILVAGDGQAWLLRSDGAGAALSRIDHTGRSTDVVRLAGQSFAVAPYRDGVVVTRRACAAEECEENAIQALVLDAAGETAAEAELDRTFGGLDSSGGGPGLELLGVQGDVVWLDSSDELIGHDVVAGRTIARVPSPPGATCLLADGVHTLVPLDGQYAGHGGWTVAGQSDPEYDAELHRLVDGEWTPVPDSRRPLTDVQFQLANCAGGGVGTDVARVYTEGAEFQPIAGLVWSPSSGWVERGPYLAPPSLTVAPEPTATGQGDQLFVLQRAGVMRRWFDGPDGPMSSQALDVPADVFVQPFGPSVHLLFDASTTTLAGCVQQSVTESAADCWIGSLDG